MSSKEPAINGELFRLRREERGWLLNDMATRACMSVKQIRQIEDGGISAFYSPAVKETAAKKVAAILGLNIEEVFTQAEVSGSQTPHVSPSVQATSQLVGDVNFELDTRTADGAFDINRPTSTQEVSGDAHVMPKSKKSFWIISLGLFVIALALSAYLKPKEEQAEEPVPPSQVVPADSASAPEVSSSSPEESPTLSSSASAK